jgi:polyisoprenoid-binding protein YceI
MSGTEPSSEHCAVETLAGSWQLDPRRSCVEFRARHLWGLAPVSGHFEEYQGRLDLSADPAIELVVAATTVQSGNNKRDRHLRSADFFDVDSHPQIRFVSDSIVAQADTLKVRGRLTARGRSISLELDAKLRQEDGEVEIAATTTAEHRKLGMMWSPLAIIPPRSELHVEGYLVPAA